MTTTSDELRTVIVSRARMNVATLDYRRSLKRASAAGYSQSAIARTVRISQPSVSEALHRASGLMDITEGFAGAGPYEICQRYTAGELERDEVVAQLARWSYTPDVRSEVLADPLRVDQPGGWGEVESALDDGLIDDELVDAVQAEQERLGLD